MIALEIWGKFASFRDPMTISQNITLPLPPKTTVAGMIASILGEKEYMGESAYETFEYSTVVKNPILKKSFSQNYINDYTTKVQTQLNSLQKGDFEKVSTGLRDKKNPQKPINRELLMNPCYIVFINNFEYEKKLKHHLKERVCKFPFYLGNSEFAGNFRVIEIDSYDVKNDYNGEINSFILEDDLSEVIFEAGKRYTNIACVMAFDKGRTPKEFVHLVLGNYPIKVKSLSCMAVTCKDDIYHCRFI